MKCWYVLLLLLLGGCASPALRGAPSSPGTADSPPPAAAPLPPKNNETPQRAVAPVVRNSAFKPDFDSLFPDQIGTSFSLSDSNGLFATAEDSSEDPPDAETLEDNLVLSGLGENPPENEGQTVAADQVFFDFPVVENEKIHYYIDYFTGPAKTVLSRWLERSGRYLPLMRQIFAEEGLPQDLAYLALVESGFNNRAYSWAHAVGPWQFIDSTGRLYGMESDWWRDERRDFEKSTRAAARFLKDLYARFDGDWYLAVASYNAGPGKIQRAVDKYGTHDFWELSRHPFLATETKNYVPKLLAVLLIAKEPEKYGFTDLNYQEPLAFDTVQIPTPTDLEIVAKYCDASYEELKELNPELKRWCTPPGEKNYALRIPAGTKEQFEKQYALLSPEKRANYLRHQVHSGDTLGALANRYGIRVEDIVAMNHIRNPRALQVGVDLVLPLRKGWSRLPLQELHSQPPAKHGTVAYKVRRGDNLWSIARKFGVSGSELRAWNHLRPGSILHPGQVLMVAGRHGRPAAVAKQEKTTGRRIVYQVQTGDSLWQIGHRYGVTTYQLRTWNRLEQGHVLQPGEKLTIVAAAGNEHAAVRKIIYHVRPGDTLWQIGRRFDIATRKIRDWNNLAEEDVLHPGDQLTLLVDDDSRG